VSLEVVEGHTEAITLEALEGVFGGRGGSYRAILQSLRKASLRARDA